MGYDFLKIPLSGKYLIFPPSVWETSITYISVGILGSASSFSAKVVVMPQNIPRSAIPLGQTTSQPNLEKLTPLFWVKYILVGCYFRCTVSPPKILLLQPLNSPLIVGALLTPPPTQKNILGKH